MVFLLLKLFRVISETYLSQKKNIKKNFFFICVEDMWLEWHRVSMIYVQQTKKNLIYSPPSSTI